MRLLKLTSGMLLSAGLVAAISCTRKADKPSQVKLSFNVGSQKLGALSIPAGYVLGHIVVNVRGPGMGVQLFSWDSHCGEDCDLPPPTSIQMIVPTGSARLIQYLGVYKNDTTGNMIMSYGETLKDLVGPTDEVPITATVFGNSSGVEGTVGGQYVTSVSGGKGKGPTGKIDVIFKPPTGTAPMIIEETEMFDGWFGVFALEGVPMEYVFRATQEKILYQGSPMNLSSITTDLAANTRTNIQHIRSPAQFWVDDGGTTRRESSGGNNILGFFGPALGSLSSPQVCAPSGDSMSSFYNAATAGSNLTYCGGTSCTGEDVRRVGDDGVSGSCSSDYVTSLKFDPQNLRNGKWDAMGFRGPFKSTAFSGSCGAYTATSYGCYNSATDNVSLQWAWIPDVGVNMPTPTAGHTAIEGATLFYKNYSTKCEHDQICTADFRMRDSDLYRCGDLTRTGFTQVADFNTSQTSHSFTSDIPTGGNMVALLCPYRTVSGVRQYFGTALSFHGLYGPMPPVNNVKIYNAADGDFNSALNDASFAANSISVGWDTVSGATSYDVKIYQAGTPVCSDTPVATSPKVFSVGCASGMMSYPTGTNFDARVEALDANGPKAAGQFSFTLNY